MNTTLLPPHGHFELKLGAQRRMAISGALAVFVLISAISLALIGLEIQRRLAPAGARRVVDVTQLCTARLSGCRAPILTSTSRNFRSR